MSTLVQDLAYGLRLMRRAPGFTLAAVLTLALGIGVNAATFSIVNVLSLKPLPYADPERVAFVMAWDAQRRDLRMNLPLADVADIAAQARAFEGVAAYEYWSANLTGGRGSRARPGLPREWQYLLSPGCARGLWAIAHGGDAAAGAPDVVVLSHGLWQRRFGGRASVVGQQIVIDGRSHTIVGVMPRRFEFPIFNFKGDLWSPLKSDRVASAPLTSIVAIGRLRAGSLLRGSAGRGRHHPAPDRGHPSRAPSRPRRTRRRDARPWARTSSCRSRSCSWPPSASCCCWPARTSRTSCWAARSRASARWPFAPPWGRGAAASSASC